MRRVNLATLFLLTIAMTAQAETTTRRHKIWRLSAALLACVTIADISSSAGRPEANPLLRSPDGRFSGRGIALKGAIVGGALGTQWLLTRKNPKAAGYAAAANFAAAGLTGGTAARNYMLK